MGARSMTVGVTGATGFTGRRVVTELLRRGYQVKALVRPPAVERGLPAEVVISVGDLRDDSALTQFLDGADALVHVASLAFGHAEAITGAAATAGVRRAVFFSSTALFTSLPAASKTTRLAAEDRVRRMPGDWTILRPTMIYGDAGDRNLSRLIRFVARSPILPLPGGGHGLVQPVHVDDLGRAAADVLACTRSVRREYNLPGAEAAPLRDLVLHVSRLLERRPLLLPLPLRPAALAAGLWQRIGLPPRISPEQVLRLAEDKAFSFDEARQDWGYAPRGFREGLADEVRRLRELGWI